MHADTRPPDLVWPEHEEFNTRPNARGPRVRSFDPSALRTLRTNSQLTRDQLAEQIGTSVSSVKMWETGHRTPTARVADRIAEVLGVSSTTTTVEPWDAKWRATASPVAASPITSTRISRALPGC